MRIRKKPLALVALAVRTAAAAFLVVRHFTTAETIADLKKTMKLDPGYARA